MEAYHLTNKQARVFLLRKQGLIGARKFEGEQGVMDFVRQAGCIQYDPIDVCGKNAELVLQSRIAGDVKGLLAALLYEQRELIDYFDKNLAILPASDWKYFSRYRKAYTEGGRSFDEVNAVCEQIKRIIADRGPVCSSDIEFNDTVHWYWSDTKLSRAALETMYFRGELVVHHKKGTIKYYDLAGNCIPAEILSPPDPFEDELAHMRWRVKRRIGAIGLLWNRASDAWLNIWDMKTAQREEIFAMLLVANEITPVLVEGISCPLYCLSSDLPLLEEVMSCCDFAPRCELLAPLDNLMWDRKLICTLFDFDYKWEIYTPQAQRKYGYYVLPILYGEHFVGRIEPVREGKTGTLSVKNIWFEPGIMQTKKLNMEIDRTLVHFAKFNGCTIAGKKETLLPGFS